MSKWQGRFTPGDLLLFALSATGQATWQEFTKLVSESGAVSGEDVGSQEYLPLRMFRVLSALGHAIRVEEAGKVIICPEPPALARLPRLGPPVAVLCGARSPRTIQDLRKAAPREVVITVSEAKGEQCALAPSRIALKAPAGRYLERLAEGLEIGYTSTPACWICALEACSIKNYVESLRWEEGGDLNWNREDFDAGQLRFQARPLNGNPLRLSRYRDPVRRAWRFRLVGAGRFAEVVDPDLGRYAVLREARKIVLQYDQGAREARVPVGTPLPEPHSRALTLASGFAPEIRKVSTGPVRSYYVYREVPGWLFSVVADKLGQQGE